jgi:DNA polymerase-4
MEVRRLPGVGPKGEQRLAALAITSIGGLAALDDDDLVRMLPGKGWLELRDRARGIDPRPVSSEPGEAVSISSEETFDVDIADRAELHARLCSMAEPLAASLRSSGRTARTVTTKLRYPDFSIVTRSHSLAVGTDDGTQIGELACMLLDRALDQRPSPLRLVGVGVSGFASHQQLTLGV